MFIYNIGIWLMAAAIRVVAPFNAKFRLMVRGRKDLISRVRSAVADSDKVVWVHCASLGEFEQGRPVIEAIRQQHPQYKIALTFFSPSGYEIRKNYEGADWVFYMPFDTPRNARRFVEALNPRIAVIIKYEFWLNHLKAFKRSDCRTFIVSAIFRNNSVFFRPYGSIFRKALSAFERIFVQNEESAELLASIGVENVTVAGDTRFDRVAQIVASASEIESVAVFTQGKPTLVAGSTWPQDEELILELIRTNPDTKFIIAPHEIEQPRIDSIVDITGAVRYTALPDPAQIAAAQVMIIDTIGVLSSVYRYATLAYIGGGFGAGIHNTLEAATYGLPLAFGPNYQKFREARELIELGCARSVADGQQLQEWFSAMSDQPSLYAQAKAKSLSYVSLNTGATDKFMRYVFGGQTLPE